MIKASFVAASGIALMAASSAVAGGYVAPVVDVAPVVVTDSAAGFSWAGGYAGVNLGYAGDKAQHRFGIWKEGPGDPYDLARGSLDITSSGFVGGAQLGWNFQNGSMVYGIEGDVQGSNVKGETSVGLSSDYYGANGDAVIGTKLKNYATLRARVGAAVTDRFLVYGTAGVASGKTETYIHASANGESVGESIRKTKTGWTAGLGAEYAVTDRITVKSEYLYTDLGRATIASGVIDTVPGTGWTRNGSLDRKFNFHTVRVGVNYKF